MSFYKRGDGIWQFDRWTDGVRTTLSGEVREKRAAWKIVNKKLEALSVVPPAPAAHAGPSIGFVSDKYLERAKINITNKKNYEAHARRVELIVARLGPDRDLFSLTEHDLEPIARELELDGNQRSPRTVNAYIVQSVRPLYTYASIHLKLPHPCMIAWSFLTRREDNTRVRYLSKDEMARLLAALPDRDGHLHQFAWITGFRASEIIKLRWTDIDWDQKIITTRIKGGRPHTVPLTGKIEKLLLDLKPVSHPTFVFSFRAEHARYKFKVGSLYPFSYTRLYSRTCAALAEAEIEDYRFHDHRHTAATILFLATGNIRLVQALLGHRNISSCERYVHMGIKDVARELERIDAEDLPHAAMAELLAAADLETDDALKMGDVFRDNIRLLRRVARLTQENQDLRRAVASAAV